MSHVLSPTDVLSHVHGFHSPLYDAPFPFFCVAIRASCLSP